MDASASATSEADMVGRGRLGSAEDAVDLRDDMAKIVFGAGRGVFMQRQKSLQSR